MAREAHVARLHRRRLQREDLVPGALQRNAIATFIAACLGAGLSGAMGVMQLMAPQT